MASEKLLIEEFYKELWRYQSEGFSTQAGAARQLGISPSRFTVASDGYRGEGPYPRPQLRTLEKCMERGDERLSTTAGALRAFYTPVKADEYGLGFSCWLCGFILFWAGEENMVHKGLTTPDGPELDLMMATELLSAFVNARYWFEYSRAVRDGSAPIFPQALASRVGYRTLAGAVFEAEDDLHIYNLVTQSISFSVCEVEQPDVERVGAVLAVQSFIAEYAVYVACQRLVADTVENERLTRRPLYRLIKEIYKLGDQQISRSQESCNAAVAWLIEHDHKIGLAAQRYVNAEIDTMEGRNSWYFVAGAFSLLDPAAAEVWHLKPNSRGDHFLPPRGHRVFEPDLA